MTTTKSEPRTVRAFCTILASCLMFSLAHHSGRTAHAIPFTLFDGVSYITGDPTSPLHDVDDWFHAGNDQLKGLSNWYRVGPTGSERPVQSLSIVQGIPMDTHGDPAADFVTIYYTDTQPTPRFRLEIDYFINGGLLGEEIRIFNIHPNIPLDMYFFEYMDVDLNNTPLDDVTRFTGPNSLKQTDGIARIRGTFDVDHREIDEIDNPLTDTLTRLGNNSPTTLPDTPPTNVDAGPGDMTWTLQWNFTGLPGDRPIISPGGMARITKFWEFDIIPEPTSAVLAAIGCSAILMLKRRRSCRSGERAATKLTGG
jgi:hypothetical protein